MHVHFGDLWDMHPQNVVVVPTNIGWKNDGSAVMGAGVAKQAVERFPDLAAWWGYQCTRFREETPVMMHPQHRLILFPTKPLDTECPWASWKADADLKLIWRSTAQLAAFSFDEIVSLPIPGVGNGHLTNDQVLPVLRTFLGHHRFQLVVKQTNVDTVLSVRGIILGAWDHWLVDRDPRPDADGNPLGSYWSDVRGKVDPYNV